MVVLAGRLPTHPRTLYGQPRMGTGQVRYLSITLYPEPDWLDTASFGVPHASVMDERYRAIEHNRHPSMRIEVD